MNYCTECGGNLHLAVPAGDTLPRSICTSCGFIHYQNPKVVVGVIALWQDTLLLARRDIEPRRTFWSLPAGYLELGETTAAGATRETFEETQATVTELKPYLQLELPAIGQLYLLYRGLLIAPEFAPTEESSEVRLFHEEEIPWQELAFPVIAYGLRRFCADRAAKTGYPFHTAVVNHRLPA